MMGKVGLGLSGFLFSFFQDPGNDLVEPLLYIIYIGIFCYILVILSVFFDY